MLPIFWSCYINVYIVKRNCIKKYILSLLIISSSVCANEVSDMMVSTHQYFSKTKGFEKLDLKQIQSVTIIRHLQCVKFTIEKCTLILCL